MKTAAKVFIWIGMVIQFFLIYPIVIGVLALQKINNAKSTNELYGWGIATAFLCSPLGGIFMLNIKENELDVQNLETVKLITRSKEVVKIEERSLLTANGTKIIKIISLTIASLILIMLLFLVFFSVFGLYDLDNILSQNIIEWGYPESQLETYDRMQTHTHINIILTCIQLPLVIGGIVWFLVSKKRSNLYLAIASSVCLIIAFILFWNQMILGSYWTLYSYYIVAAFVISLINFILLAILTIFSFITAILAKKTKKIKTTVEKTVNNMECELNEIKTLLERSVITQEEYDRIRNSIVNKYYK